MLLLYISSIITLVLGITIILTQVAYDITLLPPLYNGVYLTKLENNGTCFQRNYTVSYTGVFEFLNNICSLRDDIELNILNCYSSNTEFLENFHLFHYTQVVMYIEVALIGLIVILGLLLVPTKKYRGRLWHTLIIVSWFISYFVAKIVIILTFILYMIFRYKLGQNSRDPIPKFLSINLLLVGCTFIFLNLYDFVSFVYTFYTGISKSEYRRIQ